MKKDSLIVITGAAGFIGSNIAKLLNEKGFENLILVDDLTNGHKYKNIKDIKFSAYMDKSEFMEWLVHDSLEMDPDTFLTDDEEVTSIVHSIIHMGAISDTSEWDGKKMMAENYTFSTELFRICQNYNIKFIYASSASVYGNTIQEDGSRAIDPLNVYAFSKWAMDQFVIKYFQKHQEMVSEMDISRKMMGSDFIEDSPIMSQVVGLRFFNVYGPRENHKGSQSSPVSKFYDQLMTDGHIKVFQEKAHRDFVHVDDAAEVVCWFLENDYSGIFDVGTGTPRTFHDVARLLGDIVPIVEIPMPEKFKGHYQYYTCADLGPLRQAGFDHEFLSLEGGVEKFLKLKR